MPAKKRPNAGSFRKGQSGNPTGRPKGVPNKSGAEVRALAQQHTVDAIACLVGIAQNPEQPASARVMACRELLDRAVGKAPQAVTGPDGEALSVPAAVAFLIQQHPGAVNRT